MKSGYTKKEFDAALKALEQGDDSKYKDLKLKKLAADREEAKKLDNM